MVPASEAGALSSPRADLSQRDPAPSSTRRPPGWWSPLRPAWIPAAALLALAQAAAAQDAATAGTATSTEDFEKLPAGPLPDALMVIEGEWGIVEDAGNKVLELRSEPVLDGAVLIGPSLKEAAGVSARIKAGKSRRAHPRMGVGLYGVSGVKLRLVPAQKKIEMVVGEEVIGEAPFEAWSEDSWWQVELKVVPAGEAWAAEARVWPAGQAAPDAAILSTPLPDGPGQGRASLLGSPYANKAVHFDDVTIRRGAERKP